MTLANLTARFFAQLPPPLPNAWEVEEYLENLRALPAPRQELILQQVPAIWPVSNSLCYSYLANVGQALRCLTDHQLADWVSAILTTYEEHGLRAAQNFMADAEGNYLCELRGERGVELAALPHLQTYAQGVAGRPVRLAPSRELGTDTETIFLPPKISRFLNQAENVLYYKLLITLQAGLLQIGTYQLLLPRQDPLLLTIRKTCRSQGDPPDLLNLSDFFKLFANPLLAEELFTLAEARRLLAWLAANFPGLWRESRTLLSRLNETDPPQPFSADPSGTIVHLRGLIMPEAFPATMKQEGEALRTIRARFLLPTERAEDSAATTAAIYDLLADRANPYLASPPLPWLGRLQPEAAWQVRTRKRQHAKDKFITGLALVVSSASPGEEPGSGERGAAQAPLRDQNATTALAIVPGGKGEEETQQSPTAPLAQNLVTLATLAPDLPESLRELAAEITHDLGGIPPEYISAAQGLAGRSPLPTSASSDRSGEGLNAPLTYDEWDFRRNGFRKEWCAVKEKLLPPVKSRLIEATLAKYRGQVLQLRRQFEMLRTGERFMRRQPDGPDFDLDAVIETLSDRRAGRAGSDQLFLRLRREERDIAVYFLVDMSSSTEGWINLALKEALILTGSALQASGDRFAVAGFSGMRRTRSDFYRIKDFTEPYNAEVRGRICAIAPKEYTRMGPALRHASHLLQKVEARVRLLFVLTDGKPEDYDDYKGKYAIEDTRHALIEARNTGIHPFCITIDRQAHAYMPHMYGKVNYIFLDDVRKLPLRMPAIYRNLTS